MMFCPECGTVLVDVEPDLPCPGCGSRRRFAVAQAGLASGRAGSSKLVLNGPDLLIAHYDVRNVDREEVAERNAIEELRGKVVVQATILEDLVDEVLLYLIDPPPGSPEHTRVMEMWLGRKVPLLRKRFMECRLAGIADPVIGRLTLVLDRRNLLAHSPLFVRSGAHGYEFFLHDRRRRDDVVVTQDELREDLQRTATCFSDLLGLAEVVVERARPPVHFVDGLYLVAPGPDVG